MYVHWIRAFILPKWNYKHESLQFLKCFITLYITEVTTTSQYMESEPAMLVAMPNRSGDLSPQQEVI